MNRLTSERSHLSRVDEETTWIEALANRFAAEFVFRKIGPATVGFLINLKLVLVEGLESLAYVVMIAFLVYAVIERRVRNNLKKEIKLIIVTGGKKTHNPTG